MFVCTLGIMGNDKLNDEEIFYEAVECALSLNRAALEWAFGRHKAP